MRAAIKLLRGLWHVLVGWVTIYFRFPQLSQQQRDARVQVWAMQLLRIWGIDLDVRGQPVVSGPALLVCNHISWLDIVVIHATRHCRFVSKSELKNWPLVGMLATGAGTLYIHRAQRKDAMRMVKDMAQSLRDGDVLGVFPEGTTGDGIGMLPFHANLLQAAISAEVPIQPVALQFIDASTGSPSLAPCYHAQDTLISSLWRTLCAPPLLAQVRYGAVQMAQGRSRRTWAQDLRETIADLRK